MEHIYDAICKDEIRKGEKKKESSGLLMRGY